MTERKKVKAEDLGGSDAVEWKEYETGDGIPYFNKSDHLKRSLAHQPSHAKAVKKKNLLKERDETAS